VPFGMVAKAFGDGLRSGNNYADVDIESVPVDLVGPMTPVRVAGVRLLNCAIAHYGAPATSDIGICGSYPTAHCGAVTATVDRGDVSPAANCNGRTRGHWNKVESRCGSKCLRFLMRDRQSDSTVC
jgi:hypothetical protein